MFSIAESGIKEKCSSTVDDEIFGADCVIKNTACALFFASVKSGFSGYLYISLFYNELLMVLDVYAFGQ